MKTTLTSKVLCVEMHLSDFTYVQFKSDIEYQKHIKEVLAFEISKQLINSQMATFTYEPNENIHGATVRARIQL